MNLKINSIGIKVNPFYLYSISLSLILIMYHFGWSGLYPAIGMKSYVFFISTILISIAIGYFMDKKLSFQSDESKNKINVNIVTLIIIGLLVVDFIYAGEIPLVEIAIVKTAHYSHFDFRGIPVFHGFLISFISFFAIYLFDRFLIEDKKNYLFLFLANLIPGVLLYNRGMVTMILISCVSVFIIRKLNNFINVKYILIIATLGILFLYVFGVMGNLRHNKDIANVDNIYTNSEYIMDIGDATPRFKKSGIPTSYIWGYLYMTSPLANLENTIQHEENVNLTPKRALQFLTYSILPGIISEKLNVEYEEAKLVTPSLTVSTFYSEAYTFLGWLGIILLFLYWVIVVVVYRLIMPNNSSFFVAGMAVVNTITILNFFDNMLTTTTLVFQLVFPIIFMLIFEKRILEKYYFKLKGKK